MNEFDQAKADYQVLKQKKFDFEVETKDVIKEVKDLFESLEKGIQGGGYLSWTGDLLLDFEFRLSRYAEFLGTKYSEADGEYTYFHDKYKQKYLKAYVENKRNLSLDTEVRALKTEIDAASTEQLAEFQDKVNILYEYSRYLKELVGSIERYLLAITHRIKELQGEKRYSH